MNFLKSLILKAEGGISWSKFCVWLAGASFFIAEFTVQLTAAGIAIPVVLLPYIKAITVASAVVAGMRLRNAASGNTDKK